jgi:hypothetical protein
MDALTIAVVIGAVVLVLGFIFWLFIGLLFFMGAAGMEDLHDDFPRDKDFENRRTK